MIKTIYFKRWNRLLSWSLLFNISSLIPAFLLSSYSSQCQTLPSATPPLLFPLSTPVPSRLYPPVVAMANAPLPEDSRKQHNSPRLCSSRVTHPERCHHASASRSTSSCWRGANLCPLGPCLSPPQDILQPLKPQHQEAYTPLSPAPPPPQPACIQVSLDSLIPFLCVGFLAKFGLTQKWMQLYECYGSGCCKVFVFVQWLMARGV